MKTSDEIRARLAETQAQPQLKYKPATVQINAPLALIQMGLESEIRILKWVLDQRD